MDYKNKKWLNLGLMVVLVGLTLRLLIGHVNPIAFERILEQMDSRYFLLGILFLFIYWGLEAVMIYFLMRRAEAKQSFAMCVKLTMIGQFYSYLTPFASGGQPMQVYYMNQKGVPIAKTTAVLVAKFLLFQITVTLYVLIISVFHMGGFLSKVSWTSGFVLTGLVINLIGLIIITMMAFKPVLVHQFLNQMIHLFAHFKFLKNREEKLLHLEEQVESYGESLANIISHKREAIQYFILSLIQILFYFAIAWCVYKGFGLTGASVYEIINLQALLYMAVALIPTPGSVGASEVAFALIMGEIFTRAYASMGILMWRGITFYFGLILTGLFVLILHVSADNN